MAGKESAPQRADVRLAEIVEKKSKIVGIGALVVGILVPPLAPVAISVAAIEGAEWAGAKWYENRFGVTKPVEMQPKTQYALAA
jgi:hypothetical protein